MMIRFLFLFLMFVLCTVAAVAQNGQDAYADNASVVTSEISNLLKESRIINSLDGPFSLASNFPDQHMLRIYESLLGMQKQVRLEAGSPSIQLRLFPANSLLQVDNNTADRKLTGELHILYTESESVINDTEKLTFSYRDSIPVNLAEELESAWQGGAFQVKKLRDERNLWRQVGQPAIIAAATGVTVFLLFNIRAN